MILRVLYTATYMHYYGTQLKPHYLIVTIIKGYNRFVFRVLNLAILNSREHSE